MNLIDSIEGPIFNSTTQHRGAKIRRCEIFQQYLKVFILVGVMFRDSLALGIEKVEKFNSIYRCNKARIRHYKNISC